MRQRREPFRNHLKLLPISQRRIARAERAGVDTTDRLAIERFEAELHRDKQHDREK